MGQESDVLTIEFVNDETQIQAKQLILDGLEEHFGFLDTSLNPDLNNIVDHYIKNGNVFLVGLVQGEVVCSGALISVNDNSGRIVRMSVKKTFRRNGFAGIIIRALEQIAKEKGYKSIMLKTIIHWSDAVGFYTSQGYRKSNLEGDSVTMIKTM
ncbi:GNAT family N-acetyltransferase [Paenibacillus piri]|uniref:GNAT family N-acetyltransferase n=1 Tax=Paenibacillus piri TaxID=2547395 RepID=UPI001FE79BE0|nr:GNAT family N-acetyltransferase [Paenibacillus piri]